MIRGIDDHSGVWVGCLNVAQGEKYSRGCSPICRLKNQLSGRPTAKLRACFLSMVASNHGYATLGWRQHIRPIQGVLKHRACSDKSAVLLRPVVPQPLLDERPDALPVSPCQNNWPSPAARCRTILHRISLRSVSTAKPFPRDAPPGKHFAPPLWFQLR